jgi:hypothetical protein
VNAAFVAFRGLQSTRGQTGIACDPCGAIVSTLVRRVIPVLLVLVTLLPQGVLAAAWHQCGATLVLRSSCCCPAEKASKDAAPPSELRRAPCCDELTRVPRADTARVESSASRAAGSLHLEVPALEPIAAAPSVAGSPAPALRATAPPPPDPIYLRNASLLL